MHLAMPFFRLCCCAAFTMALTLFSFPAHAQDPEPQPASTEDSNIIPFTRLGATDQTLSGVFDGTRYLFSTPANWKLEPGAQAQLDITVFSPLALSSSGWGASWKCASTAP